MKIFTGLLSIISKKNLSEEAINAEFIFYKIVHFNDKSNYSSARYGTLCLLMKTERKMFVSRI